MNTPANDGSGVMGRAAHIAGTTTLGAIGGAIGLTAAVLTKKSYMNLIQKNTRLPNGRMLRNKGKGKINIRPGRSRYNPEYIKK